MSESHPAHIFGQVYQLPPEQRLSKVRALTADDPTLQSLVFSLLEAYDRNPHFLETTTSQPTLPSTGLNQSAQPIHFAEPGSTIGPYKVLKSLGAGGMGQVFLVEQSSPIHRTLALKILSTKKLSPSTITRFELERQTLALLDHPYIAKVIDGGTINNSQPFFVMEYVEGFSLADFLAHQSTTIHERLDLFLKICKAIRYAHQKGVIHRDLKPSNVIIQIIDNQLVPRIIDFGLAKWLVPRSELNPPDTGQLLILGTLPFVCPHQLHDQRQPPDVRSDIYGLGMLLFYLLTSTDPFSLSIINDNQHPGDFDLIHRIRTHDPLRPSRFLATFAPYSPTLAQFQATLANLPSSIIEDLDWITLKCLEKHPANRYESVAELSAELNAALNSKLVKAGPPSLALKSRKYIRRNKLAIFAASAASLVFITLFLSYIQTKAAWALASKRLAESIQANARLDSARRQTEQANQQYKQALADSNLARNEAENVSTFLVSAFTAPRPGKSGAHLKVIDILRDSTNQLMASFQGSQIVRAQLLLTLGNTQRSLGQFDDSLPPLKMAQSIFSDMKGKTADDTLRSTSQIGRSLISLKRYDQAAQLFKTGLTTLDNASLQSSDFYNAFSNNLAVCYMNLNRLDEAHAILRKLEATLLAQPESPTYAIAITRKSIAEIEALKGNHPQAVSLLRQSLADLEKDLEPNSTKVFHCRNSLARLLIPTNPDQALSLIRTNEAWVRNRLHPELPSYKKHLGDLARLYTSLNLPEDHHRIINELQSLPHSRPSNPSTEND